MKDQAMTAPDDRTPYTPGRPSPNESPQPDAAYGIWATTAPISSRAAGPAPAPKKNRLWLILAAVAGLAVVIAVTVGITVAAQHGTSPAASVPSGQTAWDVEQQRRIGATPAAEPTTAAATPAVSDLELTLKTTDKQCFGSAGCQLTVKVNLGYDGPVLSDDDTWQVTYEITGDESGPVIGSFEMTGDQYTVNEENLSTKSSKTKVTAKVTSVEKMGL